MILTTEDRQWLDANKNMLYVSTRITTEDSTRLYNIYNSLTGSNKKPNGCGSCMRNTINIIKKAYESKV